MKDEFFEGKFNKNKNINFLNQQELIFQNEIKINKNNNKNEIFDFLKEEKEEIEQPFFIMTLEFEKGKYKKIKIFPDSDPTELAFNFCKDNNLDFATMKYINSEIENLVLKFKTNSNLEEITNNSIQEVEEENMITDKTINSNEKSKDDLLNKENNKISENEKNDNETLSQELLYSIELEKKENEKEESLNNKKNKNFNQEIYNKEEIALNNNIIKESAYVTNSVRTNKDPITSADSNFISNTSSCESPKVKNDKINLEQIKGLSNDKILFKEKFMEPVNKISIDNRIINNYNYFNFDKISKNNHNINNNNIITNKNEQNGNLLIKENKDINNNHHKNLHLENIFNRKKETLKNHTKKFNFFSHNDFSKILELKKKKDEEIRILEEEQLKENKKPTIEKENEITKNIINNFSNEKIEFQNQKVKSNRTENIKNKNNNLLNKNLILDEIDTDLPNKFLFQKFEKLKKNNIKKDSKLNELISKQQNKKPNKQGRNFHNINNFNFNYNNNLNNNNNIVEKSVDIFLSGKDIFKTNKEEHHHLTSSNFDISITNRNLTNINSTNNNFFLQDFSQFTKQINKISSNKKNKTTHKHIPLPTSPTSINSKYKNNKLFQYEIFEGKKEYEPSFSKSKDFSQIKSYTYGNLNFTQRSSEKKSNRSLSRDNNNNNSKNKSITEKIINKLYKEKEKKKKKKPNHFSYRMDNIGYTTYDKNYFSDDNNNNNKSRKNNLKNSNEFDKGKKMNYGEYLYKRSVDEKNLRNEKLEKIRSKLEKNDKDKFLFKPKINKNYHPLRNKSMFEISEIKINETQNNSNNDLNEKKSPSNKKSQKNINLIYQNNSNNINKNPYIQKKLENLQKDFEYSFKPKINHNYNFSPGLNYFKKQEIYNEYSQRNDIGKNDSQKYNKNNSLPKSKKKINTKKNSFNTCCSALILRNKNF